MKSVGNGNVLNLLGRNGRSEERKGEELLMTRKMQTAGFPKIEYSMPRRNAGRSGGRSAGHNQGHSTLIYSAVALGIVVGAAASAYWWKGRARAMNLLQATPFDRVEELIASCETKIEDIERTMEELKKSRD